jgi:hypothetical protein
LKGRQLRLPEDYRTAIRKEFKCPSTEYDDEWIDQVKKFISHLHAAAAAGFGEFQPIDSGATEDAYRRNRRIEFKLTER